MIEKKIISQPASYAPWEINVSISKQKAKEFTPICRYDPMSNESIFEWQDTARKKYLDILGISNKIKCDLDFAIEYYEERRDYHKHYENTDHSPYTEYIEWRFTYQSEEGYRVPAHLVIPKDAKGNLPKKKPPIALAIQGHAKGMHKSLGRQKYPNDPIVNDRDYAIRAMKEGYAVMTMNLRCFGECGNNPITGGTQCSLPAMTSLMMGRSMTGDRAWDIMRAIDVLEAYFSEIVDLDNLICFGNSGGGGLTVTTAAADIRIKHAFPSCGIVDPMEIALVHWACPCGHREMKCMTPFIKCGDNLGLIAPRTLMITHGIEDEVVPYPGAVEEAKIAQTYYKAAGALDKFKFIPGPGGHRMFADLGWDAIRPHIKWSEELTDFSSVIKHIPLPENNQQGVNLLSNPEFTSGSVGIYGNMDGWITFDPLANDVIHHNAGQPQTHTKEGIGLNGGVGLVINDGLIPCERIVYQKLTSCHKGTYTASGCFKLEGNIKPTRLDFKVLVSGHEKGSVSVIKKVELNDWFKVELSNIEVFDNQTIQLQIEGDFVEQSGVVCDNFSLTFISNDKTATDTRYRNPSMIKSLTMPHTLYLNEMRSTVPILRYDESQLFAEWQKTCREKLSELLGIENHIMCDDDMVIAKITEYPKYTRYKLSIQTEPGYRVPCYFTIPKDQWAKPPVAITLQGHGIGIKETDYFPGYSIEDGYAVLAVEQRCFGESDAYCDTTSATNYLVRRTTLGNRVWDVMRIIDAINAHFVDMVDIKRIACLGVSAGGMTAFFTTCLDMRVLNVSTYSSFCNIEDSLAVNFQCLCYYVVGLRRYFEMSDLAGLIAPRRFVITSDNGVYPKDLVEKAYNEARNMYKASGAPDNIILAFNHGI